MYRNKTDRMIYKKTGGYFHYDKLPEQLKKTGVVCVLNGKIGTLAHELRHAKQYQDNNRWMNRGKWFMRYYKWGYGLYPAETQAFLYATTYLIRAKLHKLALRYIIKVLSAIFLESIILWPRYINLNFQKHIIPTVLRI